MGEALTRLLDRLAEGYEPQDGELGSFSDMDKISAGDVKARWPEFTVSTRALLLERASELADVHLDLNFRALGRLALDDPDPEVRERAVHTLWESDDEDVALNLAGLAVGDTGPGVRAAAALGLAPFAEAAALDRLPPPTAEAVRLALRTALADADVGVRAAAVEASGALAEPWVVESIVDAYESGERELLTAALRAMGASGLDRWAEYVSDQLYADEPEVRFEAVIAAGELGHEDLTQPLVELLADDDLELVLAAVVALGEIGGDEAVEALTDFAKDAPEGLHEAVDEALDASQGGSMFRRFGERDEQDGEEDEE